MGKPLLFMKDVGKGLRIGLLVTVSKPLPMSEWKTTKLRESLMDTIEQAVKTITVMGVQKYDSTPDFIKTACIMLLKKEGFEVKEKEVTA